MPTRDLPGLCRTMRGTGGAAASSAANARTTPTQNRSMNLGRHRYLPLGKFQCQKRVVLARSAWEVCAMTVRVEVSSSSGVITVAVVGEIDFRNATAVGEAYARS